MADDSLTYAAKVCPYCLVELDPLPKAKKKCRACGNPIWVRSGPDGLTYLLQDADLPVLEAAWAEHHDAIARALANTLNREAARMTQEALHSYREYGVRSVQLSAADNCDLCTPLDGRIFGIDDAPPIPLPGCPNVAEDDVCPCAYLPVTG